MKADQKKSNNQYPVIFMLLPVLAMLIIILKGILSNSSMTVIAKSAVITLVLTGAVTFYIRSYGENVIHKLYASTIITIGYLGSISLLLFVPNAGILYYWMLGGLLTAILLDSRLGLFLNFNLVFILGITTGINLQIMIQLLIFCILLSILSGSIRDKASFLYTVIILISVNVTLTCAINNFDFKKIASIQYAWSLFSILATLITAFIISAVYRKMERSALTAQVSEQEKTADELSDDKIIEATNTNEGKNQNAESPVVDSQVFAFAQDDKTTVEASIDNRKADTSGYHTDSLEMWTSYEILCDNNNLLLKKLRECSETLYEHALLIGDLSGRAAKQIGANEMLAKAGGLYHEIGKINGKSYIEEGLKLAEDYAFPKELTAILREHNIKYDKPNSVEAAIVMLSDNVVSTIDYIEKSGDHKFTPNKIIENIFQMRLDKGTFDSAGIALKDYKVLKEFYQAEFGKDLL